MQIETMIRVWVSENIFNLKKGDGTAYLVFYIIVPVIVTLISLNTLPENGSAVVYSYTTILISAMNCIYDAGNRWSGQKGVRNIKLGLIILSSGIIVVYCISIIFLMLATNNTSFRFDWIFLVYILTIIVGVMDVVCCFTADMAWKACVDSGKSEDELK